jgi:hypothetical protein
MCLRLYPEVPVLRMVVVKRGINRHRVRMLRMLRMRVTEVMSAAVTGVALSAPCSPVRAGCRGLTWGMLQDGVHDNTFTIGVRSPGV